MSRSLPPHPSNPSEAALGPAAGVVPEPVSPPPTAVLVAVGVSASAAFWAGAVGVVGFAIIAAALGLAYGRFAGWSFARALDRPRLFTLIGAIYVPVFVLDLLLSSRMNPVASLVRLVVFLIIAVSACGTNGTGHRMLLLGLLLLFAAAGETTDIWIAIPLLAFMTAAVWSLMRQSLATDVMPPDRAGKRPMSLASVGALVGGAVLVGAALFFAIPRFGAGWGQRLAAKGPLGGQETGLSDSVNLGAVGRVKLQRKIAFLAHLRGAPVDPETIYWRGHSYVRWTGHGWEMADAGEEAGRERSLTLPAGSAVGLGPIGAAERGRTDIAAEIDTREDKSGVLLAPGFPVWVKTPWSGRVLVGSDGSLRGPTGSAPRHYEVGASATAVVPGDVDAAYLDTSSTEPEVARWARGIAPAETSAKTLARAFAAELSRRSYSLDTRTVDPTRPLASFLAGAPAHCEYFASSMAIGLRLRGVPARVVGGFLGADTSAFSDELVVRESRAHLWVEAYVPDEGWTRYDPTPEAGRVPPTQWRTSLVDAWQGIVRGWDALVIGLDLGDQANLLVWIEQTWDDLVRWAEAGWFRLAGVAAGLALVAALGLRLRRRAQARRAIPAGSAIPAYYRHLLALAAHRGVRVGTSETAREFALRAADRFDGHARDAVALLSGFYERQRFGGRPLSRAESAEAADALRRLRRSRPPRAA